MLKSKIHRATVTDANLHYVGSVTIDVELMELADLLNGEQVAIVDIDNGARLETYVIEGERGSGTICLNGAAARLVHTGDKVIIISYAEYDEAELEQASLMATPLKDMVDTNTLQFIVGERDLGEWETFHAELEASGLDSYVELINSARDRFVEQS